VTVLPETVNAVVTTLLTRALMSAVSMYSKAIVYAVVEPSPVAVNGEYVMFYLGMSVIFLIASAVSLASA